MSPKRHRPIKSKSENPLASKASKSVVAKPPRPALSRRRKWLYRLTAMILIPALFFTLLEAGLRLGGYGYPTTFLIGPAADGSYTTNPQFALRYCPRGLARKPEPCFLFAKPAKTVRIFVLGSSAAQGVPNPSFCFGRILEIMLRERYPDMKFEVVNAAMTAINSHVAREITRDCAAFQPDLFIVYAGNNEVVGPYGPGTIFQQWSPSLTFIRANSWLKSTRTGQFLGNAMNYFRTAKKAEIWRGMEMFIDNQVTADDPRLPAVYDNFRQNLHDICSIARRAEAGVILSTVAVNLKDCAPFSSKHRDDLSAEELKKWKSLFATGNEFEAKEQWAEAIVQYEAAAQVDDLFADLRYRLGRCLLAIGREEEARSQFGMARDLDALRFRADSRINAVIREVAADQEATGVRLVDAEKLLSKSDLSVGGVPGAKLFYEHVHLTFDGNYLLARSLLDQVCQALPQLAASRPREPVLSRDQCAKLLALTPWDEYKMASDILRMMERPPFTFQLEHADSLASEKKEVDDLARHAGTPQVVEAACAAYEAALKKTPDDRYFDYRFGYLAFESGKFETAYEHLKIAQNKMPQEASVQDLLGQSAQTCGRPNEAIAAFQKALEIEPSLSSARTNLGVALFNRGRIDKAIAEYQKTLEIDPDCSMAHYNWGIALASNGQIDGAIEHYRSALKIDPEFAMVHNNLGDLLSKRGSTDEALIHYRKAVEIDPKLTSAYNNLGNLLLSCGRGEEAIVEFQKAVELDPKNASIHYNFGIALNEQRQYDEAVKQFEEALKIAPRLANAHNNLGRILARRGKIDEAISHFQKALKIQPNDPVARKNLEKAQIGRNH